MINVGFIGAGNMGYAIMKGIADSKSLCGSDEISLCAYDLNSAMTDRLSPLGVTTCSSEAGLVKTCDYVFLAVKPQQLDSVFDNVADAFTSDKVIVSICAGITAEYIQSKTVSDAKVVLVMPNTPLLIGEGASALSRNSLVTDDEFELVCNIFSSCGKIAVIPQDKMKEIIAVNGSGPAFVYLYTKYFIDYAESVGIDGEMAKQLFAQTLIGSAKMITDSGYTIDELITMVSSKGGTTIAGLEKLREGNLGETVENCCKACTNRAYELSK